MTSHQSIVQEGNVSVSTGQLDFSDPALAEARDKVCDKDAPEDWMCMTYIPKTNKLKLVEIGDGGVEDVLDELNDGKVQYFLLHHSKTFQNGKSPKLVYICWVGDGVPATIKGSVHTHADEVSKWLGTCALTINARHEDDVSEEAIEKRLAKSRAAGYGSEKLGQ